MKLRAPGDHAAEGAVGRRDEEGNTAGQLRLRCLVGPCMIFLAALVAVVPQLIRGNSCGHDFDVHLVSWLDCMNAWRHGILYPHWAPSPNYGAGEPRFVYYPPLTWMLGAALGLILPWHLAPIALTFLTLAGTGLATRALALEVFDDLPATLAGCVSLFSLFTLFTAYERSAFPEFAGGFWLPLIVLFVMRDRAQVPAFHRSATGAKRWGEELRSGHFALGIHGRAFDGSTAPLAIALAGAWLSNLPLGVMAGYLMAGVAILSAMVRRSTAPLVRAAVAGILGLGLAAIYWFPAAFERNWVDIRQATQDPGYNFESNWLFAHNANPALALHDQILQQVSWIALTMIALAVVGTVICRRRGTLPGAGVEALRHWWIPLVAIPAVIFFFLFPISRPLWYLLPEMKFLQYPWRWLEAVEAPMAILFVAAVWPTGRRGRKVALALCSLAFLASTVYAGREYFQVCYPEDAVAAVVAAHSAGAGFEGMYEYEPPGGDDAGIATGLPGACFVSDPFARLGQTDPDDPDSNPAWSGNQGSCERTFDFLDGLHANPEHRELRASTSRAGFLVLRLVSFPAWRIHVNGHAQSALPRRDDGLLVVPVPQGAVDVTVDWTTSADVVAGRWICGLSLLLLVGLWRVERRVSLAGLT